MITLFFCIVLVIVYNLTSAHYNGSFFYILFKKFFGKKIWNPFCSDSLLWIALKFSTHNIRVGNHTEIERYLQFFYFFILIQFSCKQCFFFFFFSRLPKESERLSRLFRMSICRYKFFGKPKNRHFRTILLKFGVFDLENVQNL